MQIKSMQVGELGTNCYILIDEAQKRCAVIDPGGNGKQILSAIEADGLTLCCVLLTHAHFDHTLGLRDLLAAKPDLLVYVHPAELENEKRSANMFGFRTPLLAELCTPKLYREGDRIAVGALNVAVLETPGHTPGSVTLQVGGALFCGDTLFAGSCGRTDLPGGSYSALIASLRRLAELEGDYRVLPGHEYASTLERERQNNYYVLEALRSGPSGA